MALGRSADASHNYQFVLGISNEYMRGNTFFIDNSQNVAIGVGGNASFDISSVRAGVPVLDVSGDIRCRGCIDPLGLGLQQFATSASGEALYQTIEGSGVGLQLLFGVSGESEVELWHAYTGGGGVTSSKIGEGMGYWSPVENLRALRPDPTEAPDTSGIMLVNTLIYGTDSSGFTVGDENIASGSHSIAMGWKNNVTEPGSCAIGWCNKITGGDGGDHRYNAIAMGNNNTAGDHYAVALGRNNYAGARAAVAMGYDCSAIGLASFADGSNCVAGGDYSVAMGKRQHGRVRDGLHRCLARRGGDRDRKCYR